jgi:hypothetical protein
LELTPPHVNHISGAISSRLEQARALAEAKNWEEAVDLLRDVSSEASDRVVSLNDRLYVNLQTYAHMQVASLPTEGLAVYRQGIDPLAERLYLDGLANHDELLLRRVVDEYFCSSWGDDALMALGELALERGDYAAARRNWQQISPLLRDPHGQSLWVALRDIDLSAHWPKIAARWTDRSQTPSWLAYPGTEIDLADVFARLVLVSVRASELERATLELEVLRRWHPQAKGRFGGQDELYAAALERLLASAQAWPAPPLETSWSTFSRSQTRNSAAAPLGPLGQTPWESPIALLPSEKVRPGAKGTRQDNEKNPQVREAQRPISCFPSVVGGVILYADALSIRAAHLATGKPAITSNGILYQVEGSGDVRAALSTEVRNFAAGVARHSVTVIDGIAYARVGRVETSDPRQSPSPPGERLVGLDLKRDGLLTFQVSPDDERWSFEGAPVGDGRHIFIAMRHGDVTSHAYVACFDTSTGGRPLWRTSIGSADTPAAGHGPEVTHNLLTRASDRIYFNSNLGLVAAVAAGDGRIEWIRHYERRAEVPRTPGQPGALHFDRDPSPCLVHDGLVFVAPSDTPQVFALDADTGRQVWTTDELADALHLLGVVDDRLIASGNRLWSLDARTGRVVFVWPESEHAGIRGMGRGVVAGREVFWPARKEIYVLDAFSGTRTRPPIDLTPVSSGGANLVAAEGHLIVVGRDRLLATGRPTPKTPNQSVAAPKVASSD